MHRFSIENFTQAHPGMGAREAIRYLTRQGAFAEKNADRQVPAREDATFQLAHMTGANFPDGHRNDLRHVEVHNLPAWAGGDPAVFFRAAEKYERGGAQRGGRLYSIMELSVPRELDRSQQLALTRSFVDAILPDKVHLWVLHEPMAHDGPQPHMHIMFSTRNIGDGSKDPQTFFKKPNAAHPERGGCGKERFFDQRDAPLRLRLAWTDLTNMALERAGATRRVTADALHQQGLHPLYAYQQPGDYRHQGHQYAPRTDAEQAQQQAYAVQQWEARKATLGLVVTQTPIDPGAFGRLVKEGKVMLKVRTREAPTLSAEDLHTRWELPLIGNKQSKIYHTYHHKNYGDVHPNNQVRFWTEQEAIDAGYRRAANDHYGQGAGTPMTVEAAQRHLREMQAKYGQTSRLGQALRRPSTRQRVGAGGELKIKLYRDKEQADGVSF
jgi:hypothetical protein